MENQCLFCKIIDREILSKIVYEDDEILAFHDAFPVAPVHLLIIPKKHIATLNDATDDETLLLGKMAQLAKKLAKQFEVDESGYRVLMNCNRGAGQAVFHIHMHLIAGRQMQWPPG